MKNKVSIIIPFHNVENYILECLNSVISQTLKDIEIICIDDGSDDKSRQIVERIKNNDERIILLSTPKAMGQSHARNLGLEVATGEYIGFVDSDDVIEKDMFEKMYNLALSVDSDITMCLANLLDDKTKEVSTNDYYSLMSFEKYSSSCFDAEIAKNEILNYPAVIWNKIYKREFLKSIGAKFSEGYIYEDLPFCYEIFVKANKVNILWEYLYNYRQNRTSSTMQNADKKVYDRIPMVAKTYEIFKGLSYFKEMNGVFVGWIVDDIFHRYTLLEKQYYENYYTDMKKLFESFVLDEKDKVVMEGCYCHDEFFTILENDYFGFWRYLIDKYKTSNLLIKQVKHECNQAINAIKDYSDKQSQEVYGQKKETENWWENEYNAKVEELNSKIKERYEHEQNLSDSYEKSLYEKQDELNKKDYALNEKQKELDLKTEELQNKENWINKQNWEIENRDKQIFAKDEKIYLLEKEISSKNNEITFRKEEVRVKNEEIRKIEDSLKQSYKQTIDYQKYLYEEEIKNLRNYYENKYLLVKIALNTCRATDTVKNWFKKLMKKN
jgi:glycosyltransferase involved in cell wall biosynthesis